MAYTGGDPIPNMPSSHTPYRVLFIDGNTTYDSWGTWRLVPTTPPTIPNPEVSTNYIDVPGRLQGPVDASKFPFNRVQYKRITGTWEFVFYSDKKYGAYGQSASWGDGVEDGTLNQRSHLFNRLTQALHGKVMDIKLPSENPYFIYHGRISVGLPSNPGNTGLCKVTIGYDLEPLPAVSSNNN